MTDPATRDAEADLRTAGLRCTAPRIAVLTALREEPRHLAVDELVAMVRARRGTVSTQAVYDVLGALVAAGLARRIEPAGSPALFEASRGDGRHDHHHVVCRRCGDVADVDATSRSALRLDPRAANGYLVDEAEVIYWGTCPACQADDSRTRPPRRRDPDPTNPPRRTRP